MTSVYPSVNIIKQKTPTNNRPGTASKIAVIGAFDTLETEPQLFIGLQDAYDVLGDDKENYKGCSCLDKLFYGASSILATNITTETGSGAETTRDKTLTTAKLTSALAKIKGEDWDILFIAEDLEDAAFPIITQFLDQTFHMKCPAGYVAGITRNNNSAYITTLGLAGDQCYGILTGQQFGINGDVPMSIVDSAAYLAGVIASLNVGNSMTMKILPAVTSVSPEYTFETGDAGLALLQAGAVVVKCQNRGAGEYIWINSQQPNGLDLYINRVRDYVIKEMSLHQFLGERNRKPTHNEIEHELNHIKYMCIDTLDLLEDIQFDIIKKSPDCVDVHITKLLFAGVITTINVYLSIEVE